MVTRKEFCGLRSKSREETFAQRRPKYYFLIVTNGKSTERSFFEDMAQLLPKATVSIKPVFENASPRGIVDVAKKHKVKKDNGQEVCGIFPDEIWVVFDKDTFADFNSAVQAALKAQLAVGYSNECFELFLLLYFQEVSTALSVPQYISRLEKHLQKLMNDRDFKYTKNQNQKIYEIVTKCGQEKEACRRALKLHKQAKKSASPWGTPPVTSIYELIEKIREKVATV